MNSFFSTIILIMYMAAGSCGTAEARQNVLRVSGDQDYPPYEYINDDGVPTGFNVDVFRAVTRVMGLSSVIDLLPWTDARASVESGDIDMLVSMYFSPARESAVDFSQPYLTITHSLFVRKDSPIRSIGDIDGREVIVLKNDIIHDYLTSHDNGAKIITCESQVEGLRMLARGEHDALLGVTMLGLISIKDYNLNNIHAVGDPVFPCKFCFAVTKGNSDLVETLNEGLAIIDNTGEFEDIYNRWFGVSQPAGIRYKHALKIFIIIIVPVVAVLLGLYVWNGLLRRKVAARTRELMHELTIRKKAETALRESEEQYRTLFETNRDALGFATPKGHILDVNQAWLDLFGYEREDVIGRHVEFVYDDPADRSLLDEAMEREGAVRDLELRYRNKNGDILTCLLTATARLDKNGEMLYYQTSTRDITEQRELERQFIQAQKMESIGRLAGGIAHDFNNMLAVILGNSELALTELPKDSPVFNEILEITDASQRAASLVSQLLAFSRKQVVEARPISINTVLSDMERMLRRLIGEKIDMVDVQSPDLWTVMADVTQIQQVITNLVVNARDALPEGGRITVTTSNVHIDRQQSPGDADLESGEYVRISVRDNGLGIDPENMPKIFEPFFTTKQVEQGTGLGLSTCYGIAHQNGGTITTTSTKGHGSVFNVFLPRHKGEEEKTGETSSEGNGNGESPSAHVLVVEDDDAVRKMIYQVLTRFSFKVHAASSGEEALEIVRNEERPFDLLITDVIMPGIDGSELAQRLHEKDSRLKTLMISGYTDEHVKSEDLVGHNIDFMRKPFRPAELITRVREIIKEA